MADLLSLLRDFNINKKEIIETQTDVIFGDFSWPKTAKTNYVIWGTGKPDTPKDYYTLDCVLFLLRSANLPHIQYVRQALPLGLQVVRLPDRKDLLAYLNGDIASAPSIDRSAPLDISLRQPVQKRPAGIAISGAGAAAGQSSELDSGPDAKRARLNEQSNSERVQRLAAKLDAPAAKPVMAPDQAKGSTLSEAIPLDKIANMRKKFLAKMRQTIKGDELVDMGGGDGGGISLHQPVLVGGDFDVVRDIVSRERKWKTRVTVIQSSGKKFDTILLTLKMMKAKEEGGHLNQVTAANNVGSLPGGANVPSRQPVHQIQYSRYDQERFLGKEDTQGFKIDTTGTYHGMTLKSVTESAKEDANKRHTSGKGSRLQDPRAASSAKIVSAPSSHGSSGAKKSRASRTPIIIIPAANTSLINMFNAKDLLQDMKFISVEQKREMGCKRDFELLIQRLKSGGTTVPFRVIDQPLKLQRDDWDRVVGVFVQGPKWQFKGWPLGSGNPVEIFARIKAFHFTWADMPLDSNVKQWNVTVLNLDRHKRHLDRAVLQEFWDILNQYMAKFKPHLRY